MTEFILNNKQYCNNNNNKTILQLCNQKGIDIPKFCYHEQLSIAGNCRMCLIEVKGNQKPVASCASPIQNSMHVFTNTKLVKKAREGILEFLLLNHPLDCPICDQGGECDLQDQSLLFGNDKGRFYEYKRSVNDKNCGSIIKTIMTRCIHCTRCIRFIDEFIGNKFFGLIGRGQNIEISNFLVKIINSEISGNLIDLCPVGALTSKPYSFISRPWELRSLITIDINDPLNVNVRVDLRDNEILRILPIYNNILNEIWITDITRFSFDAQKNNRLLNPYYKLNVNKFILYSWDKILKLVLSNVKKKKINFFLGEHIDCETSYMLKICNKKFNNNVTINSNYMSKVNNNNRYSYINNNNILNDLSCYNNVVIVGINMRLEHPLLNIRFKKLQNLGLLNIFTLGFSYNYNYNFINFYDNINEIKLFIDGKSFLNNVLFLNNKKTLILINYNFMILHQILYQRLLFLQLSGNVVVSILSDSVSNIINNELNLFNIINKFNDYGFINYHCNKKNILYLLNVYFYKFNNNMNNFNIFQGSIFPNNYKDLNILLPSSNYFEKNSIYINIFGYCQSSKILLFPPKNSRNDWKIIYMLFKILLRKFKKFDYTFNKVRSLLFYTYNIHYNYILEGYNYKKFYQNFYYFYNNFFNKFITNIYTINQFVKSSNVLNTCLINYKNIYSNFN